MSGQYLNVTNLSCPSQWLTQKDLQVCFSKVYGLFAGDMGYSYLFLKGNVDATQDIQYVEASIFGNQHNMCPQSISVYGCDVLMKYTLCVESLVRW